MSSQWLKPVAAGALLRSGNALTRNFFAAYSPGECGENPVARTKEIRNILC